MKNYLRSVKKHIAAIKTLKNINEEKLIQLKNFLKSDGQLFVTGVGKNADLMYKLGKTMNSVSIRSFFIDPVNACHGDFGMMKDGCKILASSKSGKTEELVNFLRHVKNVHKKTKIFLIHCNDNLEENYYDYDIFLDIKEEADHLNMIPTASLVAIEVLVHGVVCEVIHNNNFSIDKLLINHPAGNIGKICLNQIQK